MENSRDELYEKLERMECEVNPVVGIRRPCPECSNTELVTANHYPEKEHEKTDHAYCTVECKKCGYSLDYDDKTDGEHYPWDRKGAVAQWEKRVENKVTLRDALKQVDEKSKEEYLEELRSDKRIVQIFEAIGKCQQDAKEKYNLEAGGVPESESLTGEIECPACGKSLCYSISSYNGHLWGKCSTEGCLCWMQ